MAYQTEENSKERLDMIFKSLPDSCPYSLIDWGSAEGYMALNIARNRRNFQWIYSVESNQQPTFGDKKPTDLQKQIVKQERLNVTVLEKAITPEYVEKAFVDLEGRALTEFQLLINILHHFKMPAAQWYKFVYQFLSLSQVSYVMIPSREEAKKEKVWNHEMFEEWYGKSQTAQDLITKILLDNGAHFRVEKVGEWYSSYGEGNREMLKVEVDRRWCHSHKLEELMDQLPDVKASNP